MLRLNYNCHEIPVFYIQKLENSLESKYLVVNVAIESMTVKLFKSYILNDFESCLLFIEPNS